MRSKIEGSGFDSQKEQIFFFSSYCPDCLRDTPCPLANVYPHSLVVNQPDFEAAHTSASSTEIKNEWIYTSAPPNIFRHGDYLSTRTILSFFIIHVHSPTWELMQFNQFYIALLSGSIPEEVIEFFQFT
jgi:hypothetical protein